MIYKTDYHVHSLFSDGRAAPEDYIAPALEAGLKEIGFSEHLTLFMKNSDWSMDSEKAAVYLEHMKGLRENTHEIPVRVGLEVDFLYGREAEIFSFLKNTDIDYAIGSVHYLGETTVDNGPEFYDGKDIDSLYEEYFEQVIAAAASGLFDIIAHCDLIRIYGFRPSFNLEPWYRKLAASFKKHDVAYEINTNGRNRPIADFYPDRRYISIFREEGVPVCVNSDAHMPSRVAQHFDEAYELLRSSGYTEMAAFRNRERFMIPF
ncbi:MAG: histidinol-phosphatase HisJ family protein [Bacteroidales bacterium]|nr:histidinol-phosphatase HisJ family protein [Bacteroidales bacterium]